MPEPSFRERAHLFARERIYRLGDESVDVVSGNRHCTIKYADIKYLESFLVRFAGSPSRYRRWILHNTQGFPITLTAAARDGWRVVDRIDAFGAFAHDLKMRVHAANPDFHYLEDEAKGRRLLNRAGGLGGKLAVGLLRTVRNTNPDRWADIAAAIMRRVGPRLRGHRNALWQLARAFPEKSPAELERIAVGMWDNLARTTVEYAQLDRLWDYDPAHPAPGRIVMDDASARICANLKAANRPTLAFSMHSANWELAAISAAKHGYKCLIPYRRTKSEALTNELVRIRTESGFIPLPAGLQMISEIRREFREGTLLGMLIDQFYAKGIEVTMFGQPTRLSPLFAQIARLYDCPIYGCRMIRLPDRRFRYQIVGPIEPARDARGRVAVEPTTQMLATMMEAWIREHPEQWLWLHRIWR